LKKNKNNKRYRLSDYLHKALNQYSDNKQPLSLSGYEALAAKWIDKALNEGDYRALQSIWQQLEQEEHKQITDEEHDILIIITPVHIIKETYENR
jgi:hypothetical protein